MDWDGTDIILLRGGRVIQIEEGNTNESTPDGLHGGSTLADVVAHNKSMHHVAYTSHYYGGRAYEVDVYDNVARGIAFEIEPENGPGSPIGVNSIIVHVPGHAVLPSDVSYHHPRQ